MNLSHLARLISIVGHPVLTLPLAVVVSGRARGLGAGPLRVVAGVTVVIGLLVMVFSVARVRLGHWKHVDASEPGERDQLNRFALGLLSGAALLGWWRSAGVPELYLWPACTGLVVAVAMALRRRMKLSQHVAFDLLAAVAVLPSWTGGAVLGLVTVAVGWSRLHLGRHTVPEVRAGVGVGIGTGLLFQLGAWLGQGSA